MQTHLYTQKRLLVLSFLVIGIILGIIFVSPKVNGDKLVGGSVGFISAILINYLIFTEVREGFRGVWNGKNPWQVNIKQSLFHPTQIPLTIGMLWFITFAFLMYLFDLKAITDNESKLFAGLLLFPSLLLFGFSGFMMLRRNEYVNQFGKLTTGFWARFNGVMAILFGWGSCIALLVAMVFDW